MTRKLINMHISFWCKERGELTIRAVIMVLILCIAYLSDPGAINHFIRYLLNDLFGQVHKSFGPHTTTLKGH